VQGREAPGRTLARRDDDWQVPLAFALFFSCLICDDASMAVLSTPAA